MTSPETVTEDADPVLETEDCETDFVYERRRGRSVTGDEERTAGSENGTAEAGNSSSSGEETKSW